MDAETRFSVATAAESRRFFQVLVAVLGFIAFVWIAYGLAQPRYDPNSRHHAFDAAYYLAWSDSILAGDESDPRFQGAFYRAPLYPLLLALLRGWIGIGLAAVGWVQIAAALVATGWLAHLAFRWAGFGAGISTAALLGLYHPWLFFSTRLVAESCAIVLLVLALRWVERRGAGWSILAGISAGFATLARPNLLLVVVAWAAWSAYRGERIKALALLLAAFVTIAPVTAVNWKRSGHLVPVSSNAGMTLYHGNGPGAEGVFTQPDRISSRPGVQRQAATAEASRQSGRSLDPVEADRFWAREAIEARLSAPLDTIILSWNRLILTLGSREIALDEAPEIDPNPWGRILFVPFALLVGLAAVGVTARRAGPTPWTWLAIGACALTPLLFYVSSRYRLPFAVLLAVPAGVGLSELLTWRKRAVAIVSVTLLLSLSSPWIATLTISRERPWHAERAGGYAQLARASWKLAAEEPNDADRWTRAALEFLESGRQADPDSADLHVVAARMAHDEGRSADAEASWLAAWDARYAAPDVRVSAAINLSVIWIDHGRPSEAADLLSEALELAPLNEDCWNNRIIALITAGRTSEARGAISRARANGVRVEPELESALGGVP